MSRIDQIRGRVREMAGVADRLGTHGCASDREHLLAKLDEARKALRDYGRHNESCDYGHANPRAPDEWRCTCGLDNTLWRLEE